MKNIFLIVVFVVFAGKANAQSFTSALEFNYPEYNSVIGIEGMYEISSNAITNKFVNTYLTNKFIGEDLKDQSLKKMNSGNLLGSRFNSGLFFKHKTQNDSSRNKGYFVSLRHRIHFNTSFTKDLFHLYFYGNKPFAGKTADIGNFNYRGMQYQQVEFGIFNEKIKAAKSFSFAVSVSALNGQDYLEIKTSRGSLFTHADGDYIDMDLALEATQSDTTKRSFGNSNGFGTSVNLQICFSERDKYQFVFSARDIGLISWNSKSINFKVDTLYHFEGVTADNLLDSLYLDLKSEQQFKDGFKKDSKQKSFTSTLPFCFNVSYKRMLMYAFVSFEAGVEYIMDGDYKPLFYISSDYCITPRVWAGFTYAYGGYEGYHTGFHADVDFGKGIILSAGSRFVGGFFQPRKTTGQGGYAALKKVF